MLWKFQIGFGLWLWAASFAAAQIPRDPVPSSPNAMPPAAALPAAIQQQPGIYVTKQTEVDIPFSVRPGLAENQPANVRVFVSWDKGKSWHFYDERKPEDVRFRFRAKQD